MLQSQANWVAIKPYTIKELAQIYGVCAPTFKKWLVPMQQELGLKLGRYYSIPQVKRIFENLGLPNFLSDDQEIPHSAA